MSEPFPQTTTAAPAELTASFASTMPAGDRGVGVNGHWPPGACSQDMSRELGKAPEVTNAVTFPNESTWIEGNRANDDSVVGACHVGDAREYRFGRYRSR